MKTLRIILVALLAGAVIALATERFCLKTQIEQAKETGFQEGQKTLRQIWEIQKQIGAEPDGIWGKETDEKYDAALCQQYASIQINRKSMGIEK